MAVTTLAVRLVVAIRLESGIPVVLVDEGSRRRRGEGLTWSAVYMNRWALSALTYLLRDLT